MKGEDGKKKGNSMKAKELTIDTPVYYTIDRDKILTRRPSSILHEATKVTITFNDYYKKVFTCAPDDSIAIEECNYSSKDKLYLDKDEALKHQAGLRQEHIDACRRNVDQALKNYEEAVDKYFQKPLSTPCSKEFYDKHQKK